MRDMGRGDAACAYDAAMYDHNQTLVPDTFMAIHSRHGRPLLKRDELEARYELAEDLALHIGEMASAVSEDDAAGQRAVMQQAKAGLLNEPAQVTEPEAEWVVRRVAELCGWDLPDEPSDGPPSRSGRGLG